MLLKVTLEKYSQDRAGEINKYIPMPNMYLAKPHRFEESDPTHFMRKAMCQGKGKANQIV